MQIHPRPSLIIITNLDLPCLLCATHLTRFIKIVNASPERCLWQMHLWYVYHLCLHLNLDLPKIEVVAS